MPLKVFFVKILHDCRLIVKLPYGRFKLRHSLMEIVRSPHIGHVRQAIRKALQSCRNFITITKGVS